MDNDQETSVGGVVYKTEKNNIFFLLVYSNKNNKWSFPKGHIEADETEIEAAQREIFEETGITNIKFANNFRLTDSYMITGMLPRTFGKRVRKNVIYYLCYTEDNFINPDNDEISQCKWFLFNDALNNLVHEQQKNILNQANIFIKGEKK